MNLEEQLKKAIYEREAHKEAHIKALGKIDLLQELMQEDSKKEKK